MNNIQILKQGATRDDLPASAVVARPLSQPACTTRTLKLAEAQAGDRMGVWECTAGSYMRQLPEAELMHILSGRCTFTPEGGAPLRKVYVVFSRS
jgi:hypothetical protein